MKFRCRSYFDIEREREANFLRVEVGVHYIFWDLETDALVQIDGVTWPVHVDDSATAAIITNWLAEQSIQEGTAFPSGQVEITLHTPATARNTEPLVQTGTYECDGTQAYELCHSSVSPLVYDNTKTWGPALHSEFGKQRYQHEESNGNCDRDAGINTCTFTSIRDHGKYYTITRHGFTEYLYNWEQRNNLIIGTYSLVQHDEDMQYDYEVGSSIFGIIDQATSYWYLDWLAWPAPAEYSGNYLDFLVPAAKTDRAGVIGRAAITSGDEDKVAAIVEIAFYDDVIPDFESWTFARSAGLESYINTTLSNLYDGSGTTFELGLFTKAA